MTEAAAPKPFWSTPTFAGLRLAFWAAFVAAPLFTGTLTLRHYPPATLAHRLAEDAEASMRIFVWGLLGAAFYAFAEHKARGGDFFRRLGISGSIAFGAALTAFAFGLDLRFS